MDTRSAARRPRHRRPTSRSALLIGLVVALLATVPVLVPLLVTRDTADTVPPPPGLAAEPGVPALPRSDPGAAPADAASRDGERAIPAAGSLTSISTSAPASTVPAPSPSAPPTSSRPAPAPPSPTSPGPASTAATTSPAPSSSVPATTAPATTTPATATPPPASLAVEPDLVVVSVSWSPEQPAAGEPVTFTAVVRNDGAAATPEVTHGVGFGVDGGQVSWSSADSAPLAPGEERTYTADGGPGGPTWTAVPGEHELQAYVDDVDRIGEIDDGNNIASTTLTVP